MRNLIFAATCVPALAIGSTAFAAETSCDDGWTALNDSYTSAAREGTIDGGDAAFRADIRNLKRAAMTLNQAGYSDACESVVEAVKDMADNPDSRERFTMASDEYRQTYGPDYSDYAATDWKADLERSVSFAEADGITVEDLEDMDVHSSTNGEDIGDVDRVIAMDGKPAYVVLGHGGFLGIGDKEILVPLSKAKLSSETETMYLAVTNEELDNAPDFDADRYEAEGDAYMSEISDLWKG